MTSSDRPNPVLAFAGLFLVLAPMFARAMSQLTTLPYWDFDPLIYEASMVGIGPAGSLLCDVLILLGAGLCLFATARQPTTRMWLVGAVLVAAGCEPILYHGWLGQWATLQQQRVGASWGSAMIAALALWRLCRDDGYRAAVFAVVLGFVVVLALKGAHQMLLEHPETVADFKRNKEQIFAAQGWSPESSMAKGYQRRLMQNEASGWFGLSNVYASFAAMGVVGFGGLLLSLWFAKKREPRAQARGNDAAPHKGPMLAASAGFVASLGAVAMAQSKGGTAVMLLGLAFLVVLFATCRTSSGEHASRPAPGSLLSSLVRRLTSPVFLRLLPILFILLALGAVAFHGVLGERFGNLSLLFRWFYMQGATRIALGYELNGVHVGNWLLGVGPDGFKDAYLVAKNPLNPEEVVSPHSIFFDWWADLGIFGIAWGVVLVIWLWRIGSLAAEPQRPVAASSPARPLIHLCVAIAVGATFASIMLHRQIMTQSIAVLYAGSLLAWCVVSGHLVFGMFSVAANPVWRLVLGAAAVVFAVHSQIEVTASLPGSVGLWAVMLGAAAAPSTASAASAGKMRVGRLLYGLVVAAVLLLAIGLGWFAVEPALVWERRLESAALKLAPLARARMYMQAVSNEPSPAEQRRFADLAFKELQAVIKPADSDDFISGRMFERGLEKAAIDAEAVLDSSWSIARLRPDWRVLREQRRLGGLNRNWNVGIDGYARKFGAGLWPSLGPRYAPWTASLSGDLLLRNLTSDQAIDLYEMTRRDDPWNLMFVWRTLDALHRQGRGDDRVRAIAQSVIELDDLSRLDPTRRLSADQRALAEKLAKGESVPTAPDK